MASERLTDTKIEKLKPKKNATGKAIRYLVRDPECPGLYVRVSETGSKSYTVVARNPYGKQVWREVEGVTVGNHALDDVRPKARDAIKLIKDGKDPFPPKIEPDSFRKVAEDYLKIHVRDKKAPLRSADEIERILNKYVLPVWKSRKFIDIKRSDVMGLVRSIQAGHPRQASYVLAVIRGLMNWKADELDDYIVPIATRRRRRSRNGERSNGRERHLSHDEIRLIWPMLGEQGAFGALCSYFC